MRLLLDECIDHRLRHLFIGHECQSATYAGFSGLKNGAFLSAAEIAGFEVVITTDQEIPHQQNFTLRHIAILILCGSTNRLADFKRLMPAALRALDSLAPGEVVRIRE